MEEELENTVTEQEQEVFVPARAFKLYLNDEEIASGIAHNNTTTIDWGNSIITWPNITPEELYPEGSDTIVIWVE